MSVVRLRPYQSEVARAIVASYQDRDGLTYSVEIARQGGKNEISAHLEVLLLTVNMYDGGNIIKASPTFKPQTIVSMTRLKQRLNERGYRDWHSEQGYIVRLVEARAIFLSAEGSANVVGNTAHHLLEIDESQDIDPEKYSRDFRPMGASTNVVTVHYGTTWDGSSLLEQVKEANLEAERKDGKRRHFRYDWEEVARHNPQYGAYVESERQRLGEDHPLFRTQYRLLTVSGGGGFLSASQRAMTSGLHPRQRAPATGRRYVAGIDLAGQAEQSGFALHASKPRHDSTVVTIAEVIVPPGPLRQPVLHVIEHASWAGRPHAESYQALVSLLQVWRPARIAVDATGVGEPVAAFLRSALGPRVEEFKFTGQSKSALGFDLLAAVNRGGVAVYACDGSPEYRELMWELERAKCQYRANQTINFYVDPVEGHDDYLMSLALCVHASDSLKPAVATGALRP